MQLHSTDLRAIEVQVGEKGRIYRAKDGMLEVENPRHIAWMRQAGCTPRMTAAVGGAAFTCVGCGWRAYFRDRPCPRCGGREFQEEV